MPGAGALRLAVGRRTLLFLAGFRVPSAVLQGGFKAPGTAALRLASGLQGPLLRASFRHQALVLLAGFGVLGAGASGWLQGTKAKKHSVKQNQIGECEGLRYVIAWTFE